jgi:hypothetical protein
LHFSSLSEVFFAFTRDLCVISLSYEVLCKNFYVHHLQSMWSFHALRGAHHSKKMKYVYKSIKYNSACGCICSLHPRANTGLCLVMPQKCRDCP